MASVYEPNMPSIDYWRQRSIDRMTKHFDDAEKLNQKLKKEYLSALDNIQKQIADFYMRYADKNGITYADAVKALDVSPSMNRFDGLMQTINDKISALEEYHQISIEEHLSNLYQKNYYESVFEVQKGLGFGTAFSLLDEKSVKAALSYPWSGEMFSDRIWNNKLQLIRTLRQELTQGFIQGRSVQKMANTIADKMDTAYKNAIRVVRTETTYIANQSTIDGYTASGVVEKFEYLATLDNRTSEICQRLDGKVFNLSDAQVGVNVPPLHPNCRSTTVAYFDEPSKDRIARAADGSTYMVPGNTTYEKWYKDHVSEADKQTWKEQEKVKQRLAYDKKQFAEYKGILKEDFPLSMEQFRQIKQDSSAWKELQSQYRFYKKNLANEDGSDRLSNFENVEKIHEKLTSYSLNNEHEKGKHKALVFENTLGYNEKNANLLEEQIRKGLSKFKASPIEKTEFGIKSKVKMYIKGVNGKYKPVLTSWQIDHGKENWRLVTAYVD